MITSTSLKHTTTQAKLFAAMSKARIGSKGVQSKAVAIHNKNEKLMLLCVHVRSSDFQKTGFHFYDTKTNKNITKKVLTALRN
jgi:hypothetical protein